MQELSTTKKMSIIKMHLNGLSYDENASKNKVSKGTVHNVISDLKEGRFPQVSSIPEELEQLRELAIEVKRSGISSTQATIGLSLLSRLTSIGFEPTEIEKCHTLLLALSAPDTDLKVMARAVLAVEEVKQSTGLTLGELEAKSISLRKETQKLEPLLEEVKEKEKELVDLDDTRQKLNEENSKLQEHQESLKENVCSLEQREAQLASRVVDLEERGYTAEKQLYNARQDLKSLSKIGMTTEDLTLFMQKLKGIAAKHKMNRQELRERLLGELKYLDKGLTLGAMVKNSTTQLAETNKRVARAESTREELDVLIAQLNSERSSLETKLTELRKHMTQDIEAINKAAQDAISGIKASLQPSIEGNLQDIHRLGDEALKVGKELGKLEGNIEPYGCVGTLVSLVKGDDGLDNYQLKVIGLTVLRGIYSWLNQGSSSDSTYDSTYMLRANLGSAISELEKWKS